jgi:predicted short-subunit dehydrogenase-like oxidoreductase (DUF2520 family)
MTAAAGLSHTLARVGIVGSGRVGGSVAAGLRRAGYEVEGPLGRGDELSRPSARVVLLCVPDGDIADAARTVPPFARVLGHTSGATPLTALGDRNAFGLHPLQTVPTPDTDLAGAGCAIAGSSEEALAVARELAEALGMDPFEIDDSQRAAYHAAASIASNYLLALEDAAEQVAGEAGIAPADARRLLGPLVRQTVENWVEHGAAAALTGPVARGDDATVERQRAAVPPHLLPLFDELTERTRALARVPA